MCWSSSMTIPASRPGSRSAGGSRCRRSGSWRIGACATRSGTPRRSVRRRARASSRDATITRTALPPSRRRRAAFPATARTFRPSAPRWRPCCARRAGAPSGSARTTTSRSTSGPWARRRSAGRWGRATIATTASSAARPTTGTPTSPRTTTTSRSPTARRRATTSRGTSPTRHWSSSATASRPSRTSPGTCGSARAPTTPRTMRPRNSSRSTAASSMTVMRPIASGRSSG